MLAIPLLFAQGSGCCGPGTYTNGTGCDDCPVGSSCPGGFVDPTPCAAGRFAAVGGLAVCISCEGGSYQDEAGATACKPCDAGSYCKAGAAAPLPCDAGSYSRATNLAAAGECTDADPGYFAVTGSMQQTPCAPGSIAPSAKMSACELCPKGNYAASATACEKCEAGTLASTHEWQQREWSRFLQLEHVKRGDPSAQSSRQTQQTSARVPEEPALRLSAMICAAKAGSLRECE
mmetsp:Transcript_6016/g.19233  ORF Transcript_6016/g.19233 Transcript_6016/m.19233 type:complete len:233 (+) Transcript_6016:65-763(+)